MAGAIIGKLPEMGKVDSLVRQDMSRATVLLESAAHDIGDEFLQYLYGMAVLHLEEQRGKYQPNEALASYDPQIAMAANLIVRGAPAGN